MCDVFFDGENFIGEIEWNEHLMDLNNIELLKTFYFLGRPSFFLCKSWRCFFSIFVEAFLLAIVVAFAGADVGEVSWTRCCGAGYLP